LASYHVFPEDTSGLGSLKIRDGRDITIIASGRLIDNALSAAELLEKRGYSAAVVKLNKIIPLPTDELLPLLGEKVLVCEEAVSAGSVGMRLAAELTGKGITVYTRNCGNRYIPQGTVAEQMAFCGLDDIGIAAYSEEICIGK
jgi:transketolase C-terminal domain/subunit